MSDRAEYIITRLTSYEDIYSAIDDLRNDLYDQTYNDTERLKNLSNKYFQYANVLGIQKNGSTRGVCAFYANDSESKTAFLSMIVISRSEQGHGYGYILLNEMSKICRENGIKNICLEVNNSNIKAINFYKKNGYCLKHTGNSKSIYTASI